MKECRVLCCRFEVLLKIIDLIFDLFPSNLFFDTLPLDSLLINPIECALTELC